MRQLVVTGGDAPVILEPPEGALDPVALLVELFVVWRRIDSVGLWRDDSLAILLFERILVAYTLFETTL